MTQTDKTPDRYALLIEATAGGAPIPTAVVHPCSASALAAAMEAAEAGLIEPILVGPRDRIANVAAEAGIDISPLR